MPGYKAPSKGSIFRVALTYQAWFVLILFTTFEVGHQHCCLPFSVLAWTELMLYFSIISSISIAKKQTKESCKDKRSSHRDFGIWFDSNSEFLVSPLTEELLKTDETFRGRSCYLDNL